MDNANANNPALTRSAGTAQTLAVEGLSRCMISATIDGTWHVTADLATEEQAALMAAAPSPEALCQGAQHALGMMSIGSRIEPEHSAIGVYAAPLRLPSGETTLLLEGREVLWWVSQAPSEAIRALIAAATQVMCKRRGG